MRNEGTRMAKIAANIHLWPKWLCDHMLVCPGCAWSSRRPPSACGLERKHSSIRLSVKKSQGWGQGDWGLMQATKREFEAFSAHFVWIRIFGVLRSHQKGQILEHAGREKRCARSDERTQNRLVRCTRKVLSARFDKRLFVFCLNKCDLQEVSIFLDGGCSGSVEAS
jgi:hypothetical protein